AGAGRAGGIEGAQGPRLAAFDRADAGRRAGGHVRDRQGRRDQRRALRRLAAGPGRSADQAGVGEIPRHPDREGAEGETALMIAPGRTIGVLGGGQLGRMLAQAATRLGYRVHVFEPQAGCPTGAVAAREVNAPYEDVAVLTEFARGCDVVTYEFE